MKLAIELLKNEHRISSRFQKDDEWYLGVLKTRKNEDSAIARLTATMAHRADVLAAVEDAIEVLENHNG